MSMRRLSALGLSAITLFLPFSASAQTFVQVVSIFNIFVGLMVVAAFLAYVSGLIIYLVNTGLIGRSRGIDGMQWGVVILFVLAVLLAIVRFVQQHTALATAIASTLIALFIIFAVIYVFAQGGEEKEEH